MVRCFHPSGGKREKAGLGKGQAHLGGPFQSRWDRPTPLALQLLHSKAGLGKGFQEVGPGGNKDVASFEKQRFQTGL